MPTTTGIFAVYLTRGGNAYAARHTANRTTHRVALPEIPAAILDALTALDAATVEAAQMELRLAEPIPPNTGADDLGLYHRMIYSGYDNGARCSHGPCSTFNMPGEPCEICGHATEPETVTNA